MITCFIAINLKDYNNVNYIKYGGLSAGYIFLIVFSNIDAYISKLIFAIS